MLVPSRSMGLSSRLLLIILSCLLPIIALAVWVEYSHWEERRAQLGDLSLQQAQLLNGDVESIANGAHTLLATVTTIPELRAGQRTCEQRLANIQRDTPMFGFLALLDGDGRIVCASRTGLGGAEPGWAKDAAAADGFSVGRYATAPSLSGGFLPFALPLADDGSGERRILMTGLDLNWLAQHLQQIRQGGSRFLAGSVLSVADRDGVILARSPQHAEFVGKRFPPAAMPLVYADAPGIARLRSIDGTDRVIGYIPAVRSKLQLLVSIGFYEPDMMADINQASLRGGLILVLVVLGACLLTLLVARRFIVQPTRELVAAAARWRAGDLGPPPNDTRNEFGQIAAAFHALASELAKREEVAEARVAERTRELLVSNNRLQVEIAERQNTEAALVQSQKLQAVGQLAGGIAHDFNNLLAAIQGSLDLLDFTLSADQQQQHDWIERASGAVHRGSQLTGRLLAFARRQRLAVEASDVNRLVSDLVPLLQTATYGQRIGIHAELAPDLWPAMIETSQVEAAILNLALNARDAMPDGGSLSIATVNRTITGGAEDIADGDYVAITVTDSGIGMTNDVAQRAFEPFFTTKGPSGSGLGLSQVYGMVRESGGAVRLETSPGAGTSVTLLLPRAMEMPRVVEPVPIEKRTQQRLMVLAVDDDQDVLQVTCEMLRQLGYCVVGAQSGEEALARLEEKPPSIVMLDHAMPAMTGLQVAAKMRTRGFAGPIILATGYADLNETEQSELERLQGILNKPYTIRELEALLIRVEMTADALQTAQ